MTKQMAKSNVSPVSNSKKVEYLQSGYEAENVISRANAKLNAPSGDEDGEYEDEPLTFESAIFQALTLSEFDKGILLINTIPERYRSFALNMLKQLQDDYKCTLMSEKSTAELVVLSYIRILELQRRLDAYLDEGGLAKIDMSYYAVLSKDLDRATRQYLYALQTLKTLKTPPLKVSIKTNTAIVGENQVIQENQKC